MIKLRNNSCETTLVKNFAPKFWNEFSLLERKLFHFVCSVPTDNKGAAPFQLEQRKYNYKRQKKQLPENNL